MKNNKPRFKEKTNSLKKDVEKANTAIKKAKREIREAEVATNRAHEKVFDAASISKGNKQRNLLEAARDLEKATHLAGESSESTEEAEYKVNKLKI